MKKSLLLIGLLASGALLALVVVSQPATKVKPVTNSTTEPAAPVVPLSVSTTTKPRVVAAPVPPVVEDSHYIEIIDGCGPYYDSGVCVNARLGPGIEFPVIGRLRTGVVLRVEGVQAEGLDGKYWYKVIFDKELRYPERVVGDWYIEVNPEAVRPFDDVGDEWAPLGVVASTTKRIVVSLSEKMLYAYNGDQLFMKSPTSPGLEATPTPRGQFTVYHKTPSRYMQGPIPGISEQEYDLPGVPFNLYFTPEGAVIHGAYWHDHFGKNWSHGCVNLSPDNAEKLYNWAVIGMPVTVQD